MASDRTRGERLHKVLPRIGIGSRRKVEDWIANGRITVDGKAARPGERVHARSRICIDGEPVRSLERLYPGAGTRVLLYNKPEGEICTRDDPAGRRTVFRGLPRTGGQRWISVGRLDINSTGLLLFTNDGPLANRLMHPSSALEREYLCRVFGEVSRETLDRLQRGVVIDGRPAGFHSVRRREGQGRNAWFAVVVMEGRYREVRRIWEAAGCRVSRLKRIRYGRIGLPRGLKAGSWTELSPEAIRILQGNRERDAVHVPKP